MSWREHVAAVLGAAILITGAAVVAIKPLTIGITNIKLENRLSPDPTSVVREAPRSNTTTKIKASKTRINRTDATQIGAQMSDPFHFAMRDHFGTKLRLTIFRVSRQQRGWEPEQRVTTVAKPPVRMTQHSPAWARESRTQRPTYGVLGKNDTICMVPGLEAMGIGMLINKSEVIEHLHRSD